MRIYAYQNKTNQLKGKVVKTMSTAVCVTIGGIISLIGFALVVIAFVYVERAKNPKGIMVYLLTGVGQVWCWIGAAICVIGLLTLAFS